MRLSIESVTGVRGIRKELRAAFILLIFSSAKAACPFANQDTPENLQNKLQGHRFLAELEDAQPHLNRVDPAEFLTGNRDFGEPDEGYEAVMEDIDAILKQSRDDWPADYGNYGPLLVRTAWHCNGSYRDVDGRGGCDGGRVRIDPERLWEDNANIDKGLLVLKPIKDKYGSKLSWGDLITLGGTQAIKSMGGPVLGFCGGRIDDIEGSASLKLNPATVEDLENYLPCPVEGFDCDSLWGQAQNGLIYVNAGGHQGNPDPAGKIIEDIRRTFRNMGMNDSEAVALIGGGHAFGKTHGACMDPPCGRGTPTEGVANNTFTSGFEGAWTLAPTTWTNLYFWELLNFDWKPVVSPGGANQFEPGNTGLPIMMLTTDIALLKDPSYLASVDHYSNNIGALNNSFANAWYKLVTRDLGPRTRCLGNMVPPPQPFQMPLPPTPDTLPDYVPIRSDIQRKLDAFPSYVGDFVNLAYQCASTYRDTDHFGGCNGARIRFPPQSKWPGNEGTQEALDVLRPIKNNHPDISWSDLIVLAGQTAVEQSGGLATPFCGGRTDAADGEGSDFLIPRKLVSPVVSVRDDMEVKGLTAREMVALAGRPTGDTMSNDFYKTLIEHENESGGNMFTPEQYALVQDPEFRAIVEEYAQDEETFMTEFANAWTKMMIADRFAGPKDNVCTGRDDKTIGVETGVIEPRVIELSTPRHNGDGYDNRFDRLLTFNGVKPICRIQSVHSNFREDRRFKFFTCDFGREENITPGRTTWTKRTEVKEHFDRQCPKNTVLTSVRSDHSNRQNRRRVEDRWFEFGCTEFNGAITPDCDDYPATYANAYDGKLDSACLGKAIVGVMSEYSGPRKFDRRFKFKCCEMKVDPIVATAQLPARNTKVHGLQGDHTRNTKLHGLQGDHARNTKFQKRLQNGRNRLSPQHAGQSRVQGLY